MGTITDQMVWLRAQLKAQVPTAKAVLDSDMETEITRLQAAGVVLTAYLPLVVIQRERFAPESVAVKSLAWKCPVNIWLLIADSAETDPIAAITDDLQAIADVLNDNSTSLGVVGIGPVGAVAPGMFAGCLSVYLRA